MTSVLNVDTIADKAGTGPVGLTKQHAAKGWFHYSGSGTTLEDSFNASSATDNGTGSYDMNFTNSMNNNNYSFHGACMAGGNRHFGGSGDGSPGIATGECNIQIYDGSSLGDSTHVLSAMHGDLA